MDFDSQNFDLYNAASFGNFIRLQDILSLGECNINFQNEYSGGKTPLYIAASWGSKNHLAVIELLLKHGANINLTNNAGQTPLYVAASWGHFDVVNLLIKNNANLDTVNYGRRSALHIAACRKPHLSTWYSKNGLATIINAALRNMPNSLKKYAKYLPNLDDDYTDLCKAAIKSYVSDEAAKIAIFYSEFGVVAALVEAGANLDLVDANGETPLIKAAYNRHIPMVQFLIDNGGK
ncbi:hypothetical protein RN001_014759 [Aquatica leii]|uniref:Ankyrin repeat protein n=1 Tax=Aquatica leii TaxID=1421715 RepID=A0AAN7SN94_9COLE|nr:hypothetical protein RN001_014759 [Aquatica leii]